MVMPFPTELDAQAHCSIASSHGRCGINQWARRGSGQLPVSPGLRPGSPEQLRGSHAAPAEQARTAARPADDGSGSDCRPGDAAAHKGTSAATRRCRPLWQVWWQVCAGDAYRRVVRAGGGVQRGAGRSGIPGKIICITLCSTRVDSSATVVLAPRYVTLFIFASSWPFRCCHHTLLVD